MSINVSEKQQEQDILCEVRSHGSNQHQYENRASHINTNYNLPEQNQANILNQGENNESEKSSSDKQSQQVIHLDIDFQRRKLRKSLSFHKLCQQNQQLRQTYNKQSNKQTKKKQQFITQKNASNQYELSQKFASSKQSKTTQIDLQSQQAQAQDYRTEYSLSFLHVQRKFSEQNVNFSKSEEFSGQADTSRQTQTNLDSTFAQNVKQEELEEFGGFRKYSLDQNILKNQISFTTTDTQIFVQFKMQKAYTIQISQQTIEIIFNSFLGDSQYVIPIVNKQVYNQRYQKQFWRLYFLYLVSLDKQLLKKTLVKISQKKDRKKSLKLTTNSALSWVNALNFFNKQKYSKAQFLKRHIIIKLQTMQNMKKYLNIQNKTKKNQQMLSQLAYLQMILSFENSIDFCNSRLKQNSQKQQYWKKMAIWVSKQMKSWVKQTNFIARV